MSDMDDKAQRISRPGVSGDGTPHRRVAGGDLRGQILQAIEDYPRKRGRPPTIREIGVAVGITSSGHVAHYVTMLEREGLVSRDPGISRGLLSTRTAPPAGVPVLGIIAAGEPLDLFDTGESELLAFDELGIALPPTPTGAGKAVYALRVRGVSMIEDGILDGDYVLIAPSPTPTNGAIMVAVQHNANGDRGAATLKRVFVQSDGVRLQPANAALAARFIPGKEWGAQWSVQGSVVAVYRRYAPR